MEAANPEHRLGFARHIAKFSVKLRRALEQRQLALVADSLARVMIPVQQEARVHQPTASQAVIGLNRVKLTVSFGYEASIPVEDRALVCLLGALNPLIHLAIASNCRQDHRGLLQSQVMAAVLNEQVRKLLDDPNPAVLATVNPDGSPQTSVVWVRRDGDDLLISTAQGRRKERNLRRDPRTSLTVYDQADPQLYAEIRGRASVTEDAGRALAVRLAEEYEGPGAGQEYLQLPPEVVRVVVRIVPEHVSGSAAS